MNYRQSLLLSPKDLGDAGTEVIDVKVKEPISRITVRFKTTKTAQGMSAPSPANIPKIELVDGSTPLHSLTGYENQALAYYSHPGIVMDHGQHINALSEVDLYILSFGRYLWDPMLAFLKEKFTAPQLKITWDENISDTGVSTNECEVWADIFDEKQVSPIGFLQAIEHHSSTFGDDGSFKEVDLPTDFPIRQVLVRTYQAAYEPWYQCDEIRFDENSLAKIPFEYTDLEMYYRRMKSVWPMITQAVAVFADSTGRIFYFPPTDYWMSGSFMGQGATAEVYESNLSSKGGKMTLKSSGTPNLTGLVHGYLPWHCWQFPMGRKDDIEDWYDPANRAPRLRMKAHSGGTSGTCQVVLEQLRRY